MKTATQYKKINKKQIEHLLHKKSFHNAVI